MLLVADSIAPPPPPVGLGYGSASKECAMLSAALRQMRADWWLLKGKLWMGEVEEAAVVASEGVGERAVPALGVEPLLEAGAGAVWKGLVKVLQEQVGHWRGSSAALFMLSEVLLRDLRSQCLREKTGISKKAQ